MWRPAARIRHHPAPGSWPKESEAARSVLFSPLRVGRLSLAQRTWLPAMVPWRASDDGFVTDAAIDWYARFAEGQPGAIVVEATGIRDVPSGPLLRIGDDRYISGLKRLADAVRTASSGRTGLLIQLIDFLAIRRRVTREVYVTHFLTIGNDLCTAFAGVDDGEIRRRLLAMPDVEFEQRLTARECEDYLMGYRERVTDTHLPHIRDLPVTLPGLFASAARRAEAAGFDGVELHYAHAYTMASFLSALNTRNDGYGGGIEARLRLPLEVFRRVRASVADAFVVGCRFLSEDCVTGGNTLGDACKIGVSLASAGMDFLSLSRGGRFEDARQPKIGSAAYPYTGRSGYECMPSFVSDEAGPFGRNRPAALQIRKAVRNAGLVTPVVVAGGFYGFEQAEAALTGGAADIIGMARQALADPDWWRKVRSGHGAQVRLCEYTNYCEALDQKHTPVTCQLWDRLALDEEGVRRTADGKRRMTAPHWVPPRKDIAP